MEDLGTIKATERKSHNSNQQKWVNNIAPAEKQNTTERNSHYSQDGTTTTVVETPTGDLTGPRTYSVQTCDGTQYKRNKEFMRPSEAAASIQMAAEAANQRAGDMDPPLSQQLEYPKAQRSPPTRFPEVP
jgi:hypothetical protein